MLIETLLLCGTLYIGTKSNKKLKKNIPEIKKRLRNLDAKYQEAVQKKINSLFGDKRGQQLNELSSNRELSEISEEEKSVNRRLGVASANLGTGIVCKLFYPHLLVLTIPLTLGLSIPRYKSAYLSLKKHKVDIAIVDSVLITWALYSGFLFASVVGTSIITISLRLLAKTKNNCQNRLIGVFNQHSRTVWILIDGADVEIPFEKLRPGDIVVVNAGESILADGTVVQGYASIDQHVLTGESQPAEKTVGDQVFASTLILSGKIYVQAEKAGHETVVAQLIEIINNTSEYKTSAESRSEQMVNWSVLPTLLLSAMAYPFAGVSGGLAILASCGGNIRLTSPLSTINFLRITSENGILIKDGHALEKLAEVDTVVFDKTGTLTLNQLYVNKIYSCGGLSEKTLLTYAATAEYRQKHPVANAILASAHERKLSLLDAEDISYEIGYGIRVNISDQVIRVGSKRFMETENISIPNEITLIQEDCHIQGYSLVMVAIGSEVCGAIELHPIIRPEAKQVVSLIRKQNISTYIISGDHEQPTQMLARELGIDNCFSDTLPKQKAQIIGQLQKEGKVICFVGDGINDSIALKQADVSISLSGASVAAIDSAQIILMNEKLDSLIQLIDISRDFEENQKTNLMISLTPGLMCIGGVFLLHFGIYTSFILDYSSLAIGVKNAMSPLIEQGRMR